MSRLYAFMWAVAGVLSVANAFAVPATEIPEITERLHFLNVQWGDTETIFLSGIGTRTVTFVSSMDGIDLARQLAGLSSVFDRLLTMPGQLVLSGIADTWHWIAVLRPVNPGTSGYVSVMRAVPDDLAVSDSAGTQALTQKFSQQVLP